MKTNTILDAIKMIDSHDWNWRMADSGYDWKYNAAKADMKTFVKLVNTIENADVRESLRSMWVLVFHEKIEEYRIQKAELLKTYAA